MKLISVNVSPPRKIEYRGGVVMTGIFKEPVEGRVQVGRTNLAGDGQADLTVHGGVDKAVYAYPHEHYAHWERELDRYDLSPGQFGENLTVEGLLEEDVRIGDVYRIGTAKLQVSQPRAPCYKLGIRMDDPEFIKPFLRSLRTGFYLRVAERGELGAGDAIELVERPDDTMSVAEVCRLRFYDKSNVEGIRRAASLPALAEVWREDFEGLLAKLEAARD